MALEWTVSISVVLEAKCLMGALLCKAYDHVIDVAFHLLM